MSLRTLLMCGSSRPTSGYLRNPILFHLTHFGVMAVGLGSFLLTPNLSRASLTPWHHLSAIHGLIFLVGFDAPRRLSALYLRQTNPEASPIAISREPISPGSIGISPPIHLITTLFSRMCVRSSTTSYRLLLDMDESPGFGSMINDSVVHPFNTAFASAPDLKSLTLPLIRSPDRSTKVHRRTIS